jgi:hypothetical protein
MRRVIDRHEYAAYWHRRSIELDGDYYPAQKAPRAAKLWVPEERDEKRLTTYMKHPAKLDYEEHARLLIYAKELNLVPHKRLTRYRDLVYRLWGKARVEWAWRKARLKPPERDDGMPPPPHQTAHYLLQEALKQYISLSQQCREPVATKEKLLALFRKRRGYTRSEQEDILYQGEEVDWRHVHNREGLPGGTMPWDWIPCAQAIHPPEGMTIAFLGEHRYPPYILRKKAPEELEDEPLADWVEEPLEWIKRPPGIEETRSDPGPKGPTEMTRTQIRRAHGRQRRQQRGEQGPSDKAKAHKEETARQRHWEQWRVTREQRQSRRSGECKRTRPRGAGERRWLRKGNTE